MNISPSVLRNEEKAIFDLRSLYSRYGYSQYKMSKFEEYDLYVRNKDFLVSDNIITFTDTNGRLMALKPDVTLSIIKSSDKMIENGGIYKVYYDENVYRTSEPGASFKEITQVGLECIGDVDDYNIYEVLLLAAKSLGMISENFVLDVSDLDVIDAVIDDAGIPVSRKRELLSLIGEKNAHGVRALCEECAVCPDKPLRLITAYGSPKKVIPTLREILPESAAHLADRLEKITSCVEAEGFEGRVNIDFSVTGNAKYYNGLVFKGFIAGLPAGILSGGQYDKLMTRMRRTSRAIGFAVYLDLLERLEEDTADYDVDTFILYGENVTLPVIGDAVNGETSEGKSVLAGKIIPEKLKYKQLLKLSEGGDMSHENNA
ncbi:MAG: ATP phosphoribosyltransferase regulatory subunit [Clostridia bacterium]|nr:ATP phosphoribosyltransferase regulatory subunit [Clostridia bacterium]